MKKILTLCKNISIIDSAESFGSVGQEAHFNVHAFFQQHVDTPDRSLDTGCIPVVQYGHVDCNLPIFSSGWGDGYYPVYFGYDAKGEICAVYVRFIDIEASYKEQA